MFVEGHVLNGKEIHMKVIGFRYSSFQGADGSTVKGVNLFLTAPMDSSKPGTAGELCRKVFLTEKRLLACGYVPNLDDEVKLEYNEYGKCSGVELLEA